MYFDRRLAGQFDWLLLASIICIPCAALVVMYSAGYDPYAEPYTVSVLGFSFETQSPAFFKQLMFYLLGFLGLLLALSIPTNMLQRLAYPFYFLCVVSLVVLFVAGDISHGSRRWFSLGLFNLQPSEVMKLGLILALAKYLSKNPPKFEGYRFVETIWPAILIIIPMGLIANQPDLGTALTVGAIGGALLLFIGVRLKPLMFMIGGVVCAVFPLWFFFMDAYQKRRVMTLFNPEADPLGSGYHIIQSKIAVGSGGSFGKGFLQGTQNQLEFVPERTTDFIFSVLAEEWGFVGAVIVLALYIFFILRILRITLRSKELFPALIAFGVGFQMFFHFFVNIGMVLGILPVVGLPLPLFSYGGSAIVVTMFALGLVLGVGMRRLQFAAN